MTAGKFTIELTPDLPIYAADQDVLVTMSSVNASDVPADAGEVTLTVVRPDGAQIEYTLSGGDLTHPATGVYQRTVTMNMADDWIFHVQGSTLICAAQVSATIDPATVLDPNPPPLPVPGAGNEGKIARVTGGVYVPYGGGADEQPLVWRVGTGWVGQALNLAAAAAVSGLLALSHITPGANGQFLSTVGGVATWTASPSSPPGGASPQVQYNNAGVFDGAAGIVVAGTENALAFGTSPAQALGDLRHAHGAAVIAGRNNAASGDVPIVRWGTAANDTIYVGSTSTDSVQAASLRFGVGTGGDFRFEVNGVAEYNADATALTMNGNNLLMGAGFVSFGTNPATVGNLRGASGSAIIVASRNGANTQDVTLLRIGQFSADQVGIGDDNNASGIRFGIKTGTNYDLTINGTLEYQFTSTQLSWNANNSVGAGFYSGGGTVSGSGLLRGANNVTLVSARNAANSADIRCLATDGSNVVLVGDTNAVTVSLASSSSVAISIGGSTEYTFDASKLDLGNNFFQCGTNPAGTGTWRNPNNTTLIASRNAANSADILVLATNASNEVLVGDTTNTVNLWQQFAGSMFLTRGATTFARFDTTVGLSLFNGIATYYPVTCSIVTLGASAAASGLVRAPNNTTIVAARDAANANDLALVSTDSSNNALFGMSTFGGTGGATVVRGTDGGSGGLQLTVTGAGPVTNTATLQASVGLNLKNGGFIAGDVGTAVAVAGALNVKHGVTVLSGRNNGNSIDMNLMDFGVAANDRLRIANGAGSLLLANVNTAFFGGTPASKQTVTGSRSANAALASLLTALSTYGLLTDSSTA